MPNPARTARLIEQARPDGIHIATEGPIGLLARRYCRKHRLPFTTSFHTRFPEYVSARLPVPEILDLRAALRLVSYGASDAVMAATPALATELRVRGFRNVVLWPRGVDAKLFHPRRVDLGLPRPIFVCVGRVAVEKNLEAFLGLDLPGTKLIVGDGPARAALARKYPLAVFFGARQGEELAQAYAGSDVFVFPSRTDTFGLVLLEALASGLPVAAFPVTGPRDVIGAEPDRRAGRRFARRLPGRIEDIAASLPRVCRKTHLGSLRAGLCRSDGRSKRPSRSSTAGRVRRPRTRISSPDPAARALPMDRVTR